MSRSTVRAVSAAELLAIWEEALSRRPFERALLMLSGYLREPFEAAAQLSLGQRDARLFEMRAGLFGPQLTGLTLCPACAERVELRVDGHELFQPTAQVSDEPLVVEHEDFAVRFRLPMTGDLMELPRSAPIAECRDLLLRRCLLDAQRDGVEVSELPASVAAAVTERMSQADPLADIQLALACPHCGHTWSAPFDMASFLWTELDVWARRTLQEIHLLASTYGWSEAEILRLNPARRQFYLNLVSS